MRNTIIPLVNCKWGQYAPYYNKQVGVCDDIRGFERMEEEMTIEPLEMEDWENGDS